MTLKDLGYNDNLAKLRTENGLDDFDIGRVIAEHRERYIVKNEKGEYEAEITGNMRFSAKSREDFPAVGDWVALISYDSELTIIHSILPRVSLISRQAVGKYGERQLIASNIDYSLIVQAVDRDFNINRLERYLTISFSSGISPVIVLTKTDLIDKQGLQGILKSIITRTGDIPVLAISNMTKSGYESLLNIIERGNTYCLLGSSGVGKSTLLNNLSGKDIMKTSAISESTSKGKHTTSHRELIVLEGGGILIDNPGMREIGIADDSGGLETTFDRIMSLADNCRFTDCTHTNETGCAVIKAVEKKEIDRSEYENYLKLEREKKHFGLSESEKRKKDKDFGKMIKNFKSDIQKVSNKHNKSK